MATRSIGATGATVVSLAVIFDSGSIFQATVFVPVWRPAKYCMAK